MPSGRSLASSSRIDRYSGTWSDAAKSAAEGDGSTIAESVQSRALPIISICRRPVMPAPATAIRTFDITVSFCNQCRAACWVNSRTKTPRSDGAGERRVGPRGAIAARLHGRLDELHRDDTVARGSKRCGIRIGRAALAPRGDFLGGVRVHVGKRAEIALGIARLGARRIPCPLAQISFAVS